METESFSEENSSTNNVSEGFHIGAIFIVLSAGFLGVVAPAILVRKNILSLDDKKFIIGKAFSGGIILGTGFIHMLPEAQNQLNESLPDFPFSGLFAGMAAILSLIIEQIAFEQIKKIMHMHNSSKEKNVESVHLHFETAQEINKNTNANGEQKNGNDKGNADNLQIKECKDCNNNEDENCDEKSKRNEQTNNDHHKNHEEHGHTHGMADLYADEELCKKVNSFTIAHVLEIGIAFHSIIIGIALSVENTPSKFKALLIAISFHQFFEGFALGSSVQGAKITSLLHVAIMTMIFSLATPIGQAIGLGVSSLYDEESPTAQQTQGIFDSVSGGILIYMALVDLIGEDFKKTYKDGLRYWMLIALTLGFGFMSILAIWA